MKTLHFEQMFVIIKLCQHIYAATSIRQDYERRGRND